ncbi:MAG: hypothetical protein IPM29_03185 [Planctomycetes bacterium]|nr:hypothetical protein [Planctomycetota bacterium]
MRTPWIALACAFVAPLGAQMVWRQVGTSGPVGPGSQGMHVMAYDDARQEIVLFGGDLGGNVPSGETWLWDGTRWRMSAARGPSPRLGHDNLAVDAGRGELVLFGGWIQGQRFADTWLWDGTTWSQATNAAAPTAREWHAMAWHAGRQEVVLFGGTDTTGPLGDTWVWDGSQQTWTRLRLAGPPARQGHSMVHDRARDVIVLYGGADSSQIFGDTWELDGSSWRQVPSPGVAPGPRVSHQLAYDAQRERVVMVGGWNGSSVATGTWEWDGTAWHQVLQGGPSASGQAMAHDAARGECVFYARSTNQTWAYAPTIRGATAPIGFGCAGSVGVPDLIALGPPIIGNGDFALRVSSVPAGVPAFLGLSLELAATQMPPCWVYPALPFLYATTATTGTAGTAEFGVAIPWLPALSGAALFAQGGAIDSGGALLGIASLSPGLQIRIGD